MNKLVIYTCLTGEYDNLKQPLVIDTTFDYICFSNNINKEFIGVWKIKKLPFPELDNTRLSRTAKILPHKVLENYDYSLYIDANIQILTTELYQKIKAQISKGALIAQVPHTTPPIDCIYDEIPFCIMCGSSKFLPAYKQFLHLKKEGFPEHYGLFENNIIFRKHNDISVIRISEEWWNEYEQYSKRDQFSLMYIYWRNQYLPNYLFDDKTNAWNSTCIKRFCHIQQKKGSFLNYIERQINKILIKLLMRKKW